ncbi:MAG: GAF and ANTAR domain-containing protein [Acidimicrobiales bacterium]
MPLRAGLKVLGERLARVLARMVARPGLPGPGWWCESAASIVGMTGAGIMLMSAEGPRGSVGSSDDVSALIEELQLTLGEGPCIDAYRHDRPVLEPDLAGPAAPRWPGFAPPALDAGARAVFGFPMQVGTVRLGAVNLYRGRPGPLSDDPAHRRHRRHRCRRPGCAGDAGRGGPDTLGSELATGGILRRVVPQAAGMASVQVDVSMAEAVVRLQSHAFSHDRLLVDVARDIVTRRLRLDCPRVHGSLPPVATYHGGQRAQRR